ncbi:Tripartite tricarboxylate transporter family receptor [Pigmentiphaga humi]|uniref:Tripartite tricarboxylate transporter family receptor n=1 Tax=Pigmentiphaga humi TaxID=2478468 RepID=A0A3P4AXJ9_9BURK|nr:tripartite tricarboxylate transporter substrate binding protein [Pigmentiphaga humi]VCU68261.1 Tripartite tricarboxylate transporter family receptor [Pigmentiphaga humi]
MNVYRFKRSFIALASGMLLCGAALAQDFSNKPIRIFVPNPPGGGADLIARLIASKLAAGLGTVAVVENKPGGSSIISTDAAAKAAPDGTTMALITDTHSINAVANAKLPYDSINDFAPVAQLIRGDWILVASKASGITSLQDLIAKAKAQPGRFSYGSTGIGSVHHLATELVAEKAGIKLTHVPYKGVSQALADVLPGHIDLLISGTAGSIIPEINAGKLAGLAVTGDKRLTGAPGTPTFAQAGLPQFQTTFWYGLVAPKNTPADVVSRLNAEVVKALRSDDVREQLAKYGMQAAPPLTPAQFRQFMIDDVAKYKDLIETTGTRLE